MKFLEYRECIAISRNTDNRLYCVKIKSGKKGRLSVSAICSADVGDNFLAAVAIILSEIRPEEHQLVIYGGTMQGVVCQDFLIPQLSPADIPPALDYELSRHLPCELPETVTGYRVIGEDASGKMRVRTITSLSGKWNEELAEIRSSGLKIDAFIHPFMAIDPLLSNVQNVFLKNIEPDFQFSFLAAENLRKITVPASDAEKENSFSEAKKALLELIDTEASPFQDRCPDEYVPAVLLGIYGLSSNFESERTNLLPIPKGMFPERFRWLRIAFLVLSISSACLLVALFLRNVYEDSVRLDSIGREISKIKSKLEKIENSTRANKKFDDMIAKIKEVEPDMGNHEILLCLHDFNKNLPDDMWVQSFNFRQNYIDARVIDKGNSNSDPSFEKSVIFSDVKKDKRTNPDQSKSINYRIHYVSPAERYKAKDEWTKEQGDKEERGKQKGTGKK